MATPLRGRAPETARLADLLDRLDMGSGVSALVLGEAGVGKSRLMDEVSVLAHGRGQRIIRINADEIDLMSPLSTLLRGLTAADALSGAGSLLDETAASRPADIWLLNEIQSQLERAAGTTPLLVIIDDVDRADDLSLHAVRLLSRSLESSAIAWLLTARAEPLPRLSRLRGSIARHGGMILTLRPLADTDAVQMVEDLLGARPPAALLSLAHAAGGNALLLSELVNGYLAEGRVASEAGTDGGLTLPDRVREAIRSRVAAMPADAIELLEVAAVLGRAFRVADLAAVTKETAPEVLRSLRPLLNEGMITERAGQLVFRHELLREAVLADLPAEAVRLVHRDVASILLDRGESPVDVASHLLAGVGPGDADLAAAVTSASERLVATSPGQAAELARRALDISADDAGQWLESAPRVAMVLTQVGELDEARDVLSRAVARGIDGDSEARGRAALSDALWRQSRTTEALAAIRPVLHRNDISAAGRVRLEVAWARTRVLGGQPGDAVDQLAASIRKARELGDRGALTSALASRSMALRFVGRFRESIDDAQEAVAVQPSGSAWQGIDARVWLARSLSAADGLEDAEVLCRDLMRDSNSSTGARDLPAVSSSSARLLLARGQIGEARTEAEAGIAAMEAGGSRELAAELYAGAAMTTWLEAGPDAARQLLQRVDGTPRDNTYGMKHLELVRLFIGGGQDATATRQMVAPIIAALADSYGQLVFDPFHGPSLVRCLVTAGLTAEADTVVGKCRELAALNPGIASWQAAGDQSEGLRAGDAHLLRAAADGFEKSGRQLAAALAALDVVTLPGRRPKRADRDRVAASLRAVGADSLADQVVEGSGRPGGRGSRPVSGWASLTPAELRVVELAAEGATNKEIAQRLWISPYTVDTHMRHSLAKLGLRSRVALARFAAEQSPSVPGTD
ncbi:regulatory LuxR family protein [Kribbella pratensis]|uniref:Regulatory LuxR family protein n=1 Tax=Kribbella pratensis TaxID=2512112 RepID=A0ABY2FJZ4_9ACTN|nr:LuxR family transcriptional regulator [Kribbella pratensis]TDW93448.1 regulatory LuxR family protein [Kribbella pratensis]